jgi:thiol-disulfide isomerase/thioredoxin
MNSLLFKLRLALAVAMNIVFLVVMFMFSLPLLAQQSNALKTEKYVLGWVPIDSIYKGMPLVKPDEEKYVADAGAMAELKQWHYPTGILVFFGSWCGDSKRELPRFFAALHGASNQFFSTRYFGLDRSKKDSAGFAIGHQITNVPTFIFFRDGLELGRIVEEPTESIEKDWVQILHVDPATAQREALWRAMRESLWPMIARASMIF